MEIIKNQEGIKLGSTEVFLQFGADEKINLYSFSNYFWHFQNTYNALFGAKGKNHIDVVKLIEDITVMKSHFSTDLSRRDYKLINNQIKVLIEEKIPSLKDYLHSRQRRPS